MALLFNGSSGYLDCGNSPRLNPRNGMTLHFRCKPTSTSSQLWVFGRDDNALGRAYAFGILNGNLSIQINGSVVASGGSVTSGTWYSVCFVGDPVVGWKTYLDGVNTASDTWLQPNATTGPTTIARRSYSGYEEPFPGALCDIAMWDYALPIARIVSLVYAANIDDEASGRRCLDIPLRNGLIAKPATPVIAFGSPSQVSDPPVVTRRPFSGVRRFAGTSPPPPPPTYIGARYQMIGVQQFSGGRAA